MQNLDVNEIVPLNLLAQNFPIDIDVVYAKPDHPDNHFKGLYHPDAQIMWAHKEIAAVTLLAANIAHDQFGWRFKINDCLRPVEAQEGMAKYGYDPSLVSTPGSGAHPRAMAIDIEPIDQNGQTVPMGTPFDYFTDDITDNPAARDYTRFQGSAAQVAQIWSNRAKLEFAMRFAATTLGQEILPLPQEFWDFREVEEKWAQYAPLREADLLPCQRLIEADINEISKILNGKLPDAMAQSLQEVKERSNDAHLKVCWDEKPKPMALRV